MHRRILSKGNLNHTKKRTESILPYLFWWCGMDESTFEDTSFKAIKKYDMYLRQVFGDYMQLPPVEKRRSHGLEYVDFGKY